MQMSWRDGVKRCCGDGTHAASHTGRLPGCAGASPGALGNLPNKAAVLAPSHGGRSRLPSPPLPSKYVRPLIALLLLFMAHLHQSRPAISHKAEPIAQTPQLSLPGAASLRDSYLSIAPVPTPLLRISRGVHAERTRALA